MKRDAIGQHKQLFDNMLRRMEELKLAKKEDTGVRAEVIAPPLVTETLLGLPKALGFGVVAGFFFGAVIGYLLEFADKCFRSPEELRSSLGVSVISHIPYLKE